MSRAGDTIFHVGGPVTGPDFYGRKEELQLLRKELISKGSLGIILTGLRRVGKTSLLKEFSRSLEKDAKATSIYVDVSSIHPFSLEHFYDALVVSSFESYQKKSAAPEDVSISEALGGSFEAYATLLRKPSVDNSIKDYIELRFKYKEGKAELQELLKKSFEVIEALASTTKGRSLLLLDESQFLPSLDENLFWAIRATVQEWKHSSIVLTGSDINLMEGLFNSERSPFYLLLKNKTLDPFDIVTTGTLLRDKLKESGASIDKSALKSLHAYSGGIPFYVQWLGDKALEGGKEIGDAIIEAAYQSLLKESEIMFTSELDKVSSGERTVLIEMALGSTMAEAAKNLGKSVATVAKLVERLVNKSHLRKIRAGQYKFTDPMMRNWIEHKYGKRG